MQCRVSFPNLKFESKLRLEQMNDKTCSENFSAFSPPPILESEKSVLYLGDISGIEKLLVCSNFEGRFQVDIGSRGFVRGIVGGWNER